MSKAWEQKYNIPGRLKRYSPLARNIINEAQVLANSLRHKAVVIMHLSMTIFSYIETDRLFKGTKKYSNASLIPTDIAKEFLVFYNTEYQSSCRSGMMKSLPQSNDDASAFLSYEVLTIMTFAEDKVNVTVRDLMSELMAYENNFKRDLAEKRKIREQSLRRDD